MNECQDDVFRQSIDSPWDFFGLQKKKKEMGFAETLKKAGTRALGGGVPGAIAMVLQVPFRVDFLAAIPGYWAWRLLCTAPLFHL